MVVAKKCSKMAADDVSHNITFVRGEPQKPSTLTRDHPLSDGLSTFPLLDHILSPDSFALFARYELFILFVVRTVRSV